MDILKKSHRTLHKLLHCETLMSAKQAISDRLQSSVATYLMCAGSLITKLRTESVTPFLAHPVHILMLIFKQTF